MGIVTAMQYAWGMICSVTLYVCTFIVTPWVMLYTILLRSSIFYSFQRFM